MAGEPDVDLDRSNRHIFFRIIILDQSSSWTYLRIGRESGIIPIRLPQMLSKRLNTILDRIIRPDTAHCTDVVGVDTVLEPFVHFPEARDVRADGGELGVEVREPFAEF